MLLRALAGWMICLMLTLGNRAFGAEMKELPGPSFAVGDDTILTGDEPEFSKCKLLQEQYLAGISAKAEVVVYARSDRWGYVLRALYSDAGDTQHHAELGTLVCWRAEHSDKTNFLIDVPGNATDLKRTK